VIFGATVVTVGVLLSLLCEIGVDWSAVGIAGRLRSWMGLCPNNKMSGGKVIRRTVMPGQVWLRNMLRHAAASLARSEGVLGEHHRRMRGKPGPIGASTGHVVSHQVEYDEQVLAVLDAGREARRLDRLRRQAAALGLNLVAMPTPSAPDEKEAA
jgi:hypothetical protein